METLRDRYPREYSTWAGIKQRCYNKNNKKYSSYGGKGIVMSEKWLKSFETFNRDMGDKPIDNHIHRTDNDGNYEPGNCVWIEAKKHRELHKGIYSKRLTAKQANIYAFLFFSYTIPTLQELSDNFNITVATVAFHLKALRRKGKIDWQPYKRSSLVLF